MDFEQYKKLVSEVDGGKQLPQACYLHIDAVRALQNLLSEFVLGLAKQHELTSRSWNICKLHKKDFKLSLLHYPDFNNYPYPALKKSFIIDVHADSLRKSDYSKSENPPILHRRETFFLSTQTGNEHYAEFTKQGEELGLYENARSIGLKQQWERLIKRKGYKLDERGNLRPIQLHSVTTNTPSETNGKVDRHKTALKRDKLSTPMFKLATLGYLDGHHSILDYGCGQGDDIRELTAHGISCAGWDPVYAPETVLLKADIVNLGFVLNVIEDRNERKNTLEQAFGFCKKCLIVSVMIGTERIISKHRPYKDGVITQRNTFQKYYDQTEFKNYVESILQVGAIAVAPGSLLVFKDKVEEQLFLLKRAETKYVWKKLTRRPVTTKTTFKKSFVDKNIHLLEDFWSSCLELARLPGNDEFENSEQLRHIFGSHSKAYSICSELFDDAEFDERRDQRRDDLLVYFALSFFSKRPTFYRMPAGFQRDITEFFQSYTSARDEGKEVLFGISDPDLIYEGCKIAHASLPASVLNGQHDFMFHRSHLTGCPPILRVYVGSALHLYGDLEKIELLKVHIGSGKVTLLGYDNWNKDIPFLEERIKINLRQQTIDFFDNVEPFTPQPLENKNDFIAGS